MEEIIHDNLERMGDFAKVRVAIVGYRDYDDKEHLLVHPFTTEVGKIKAFLDGLEAEGGGDQCEDVLTGLEEALKLDWSSTGKVLYLLSQTPNHGWRFHSDFQVSNEKNPGWLGHIGDEQLPIHIRDHNKPWIRIPI